MRYLFIINPAAGKENPEETIWPVIQAFLDRNRIPYDFFATKSPGHAFEFASKEIQTKEPLRIYAIGGDGTFREIAAAAANSQTEVGIFPCGSGDDYIRNFGSKEDFLHIERQLTGKSKRVDLIETNYGIAVNVSCMGLDAKVAFHMTKYKRVPFIPGPMAYNLALVQSLCSKIGNELSIIIDGQKKLEGDYVLALASNGGWYGGGYYAAPKAITDDGLLEIVLVKTPKIWKAPKMASLYKKGMHMENEEFQDYLEYCRATELQVLSPKKIFVTLDGECFRTENLYCKIMPGALRFIVPEKEIATI